MSKKKPVPAEHPAPWGSALWPHLELIRSLRLKRKRWVDISTQLKNDHGIKLSHRTVRNFFKRAINAELPLGFEPTPNSVSASERAAHATDKPPQTDLIHSSKQNDSKKEEPQKPTDPFSTEIPTDNSDPFATFKKEHNL